MNIDALEVYEWPGTKIRIGNKDGDGGYVIAETDGYDCLISAGIGGDISFELDFISRWKVPCFAFDGTSDANYNYDIDNGITFVQKNVGNVNDDKTTDLIEYIARYKNIFLKMDIEGHEYKFINNVPKSLMTNIKQMVVEIHYPMRTVNHWNIFDRINWSHALIHLHPNSQCGFSTCTYPTHTLMIPNVPECTYIRREPFFKLNSDPIPNPVLDKKNGTIEEQSLIGYPYN
jgi:hypothetical protein